MSDERSTSIGREKETNVALRVDERSFVEWSASVSMPKPPTTELVVALNRGPWVAARAPLGPVSAGRNTVLDVRPVADYVAGHVQARSTSHSTAAHCDPLGFRVRPA
jgi:hypothetical protein